MKENQVILTDWWYRCVCRSTLSRQMCVEWRLAEEQGSNHVIHLLYTLLNGCGGTHAVQCCKHWWLYTLPRPPSPHTPQTSPLCLLLCSFPAQIIQISALRFKPIVRRDYKRGPGKIKSLCLTYRQKADDNHWRTKVTAMLRLNGGMVYFDVTSIWNLKVVFVLKAGRLLTGRSCGGQWATIGATW